MERVTPFSKYNYYKYYNARKEHYKMNYLGNYSLIVKWQKELEKTMTLKM